MLSYSLLLDSSNDTYNDTNNHQAPHVRLYNMLRDSVIFAMWCPYASPPPMHPHNKMSLCRAA